MLNNFKKEWRNKEKNEIPLSESPSVSRYRKELVSCQKVPGAPDTQHDDIQHNDTQHSGIIKQVALNKSSLLQPIILQNTHYNQIIMEIIYKSN